GDGAARGRPSLPRPVPGRRVAPKTGSRAPVEAICAPMTQHATTKKTTTTKRMPGLAVMSAALTLALAAAAAPAGAQFGDPAKVTLKTTPVAGNVSMIEGANGFAGGNVGVSVGDDGVILIDDEIQPMTPKLKAALGALSKKPVRFLVNTHWHMD